MVKDALGYKFHWAVADYLQRAARHIASKTDVEQAYALGKSAVKLALKGHNAVMPTVVRTSDKPYKWKVGVAQLKDVANVEKMMPRDFITHGRLRHHRQMPRLSRAADQGRGLSAIQGWPAAICRLKNVAVPKKLGSFTGVKRLQHLLQGEKLCQWGLWLYAVCAPSRQSCTGSFQSSGYWPGPPAMSGCVKSQPRSRKAPPPI